MASTNVSWAIRVFGRKSWDATRGELRREGERVVRGTMRVKDEGLGARHSRRGERRASQALRGVVKQRVNISYRENSITNPLDT